VDSVENCDLGINKCLCHFDVLKENSEELPDGGVDKCQNASAWYLNVISLQCALTVGKYKVT